MLKAQLLKLISDNAALSIDEMAARLDCNAAQIRETLAQLEQEHAIFGYRAIIDENAIGSANQVQALIEVRVTPRRDGGFDSTARRIAKFSEVTDLCLVSGSFDLLVTVRGQSLQDVARFVAEKLSTIDGVISTATSFQLKKYKDSGRMLDLDENYERLQVCP